VTFRTGPLRRRGGIEGGGISHSSPSDPPTPAGFPRPGSPARA
jgi:hypothetical protein